ncbi:MAG TPA: hypothetical protein GX707_11445 [Epulopiscium sp.]|nr:hypothetical protein [Candidatus Epulonipiscium sp.]
MKKFKKISILFIIIICFFNIESFAMAANYNSYTYNEWKESVAAPASYAPLVSKTGNMIGVGGLKEPQDIFMDVQGNLYIADTANNRVVITDKDLNLLRVLNKVYINGNEEEIIGPTGLYISEDNILYISQPSLSRILLIKDDQVIQIIEKPVNSLISEDFIFEPTKIGVDIYGRLYVLSKGSYTGLLKFDQNGEFMDFFGANKVEVTSKVLFQYMWKNILSDTQRSSMTSIIPIEYSNIHCNEDGFIYTTTVGTSSPYNQVKKLNPLGNNTYKRQGNREINFGDYERSYNLASTVDSSFIDLKVDEEGFIFGLDYTRGRIFERDQEGNLISVFGGIGNQFGTFTTPIAIETYDRHVYILDSLKNNITIFKPTEYGLLLREATVLYNAGKYEESAKTWEELIKRNNNNILVYEGLGKAFVQEGEYRQALANLKKGGERYSYSRAFAKTRLDTIRQYGPYIIFALIVMIIVLNIFKGVKKLKDRRSRREK